MGELNQSLCYEENAGQLTETVATQIAQTIRKVGGVIPVPAKGLRTTGALISPRAGEDQCLNSSSQVKREKIQLSLPFSSIQALSGLKNAQPHWGEPSALLRPPIQVPVSSGNILTDTPRNYV